MRQLLNRLINQEIIDKEEAKKVLINIASGKYNQSQVASFITVYMMRPITVEELSGFREALLELCIRLDFSEYETLDIVGTGGDEKNTFNISTLSCFVCAGAGIKVTKHGNYGVSSACGSSNVMESLGIKFTNDQDFLRKCLEEAGICILHAPLFNPAMKNIAPIRKELVVRTFFNILGPLINPSFPKHQLLGVFNLEVMRLYSYLCQDINVNATIIHALDGYDEISLTGSAKMVSRKSICILNPSDFNCRKLEPSEIYGGGNIQKSAEIFMNIIDNKGTEAQKMAVCANAGLGIATVKDITPLEGFEIAKESLESGKAKQAFLKLQRLTAS